MAEMNGESPANELVVHTVGRRAAGALQKGSGARPAAGYICQNQGNAEHVELPRVEGVLDGRQGLDLGSPTPIAQQACEMPLPAKFLQHLKVGERVAGSPVRRTSSGVGASNGTG